MTSIFETGGKAVNKDTAMAISGGTNYERIRSHSQTHFKIKPLCQQKPDTLDFAKAFKQNIGLKRGRLTIVDWFCSKKWLCRCTCGDYVTRPTRSFSPEKLQKFDACPDCENLVQLKKNEHYRKTGKDSEIEDFA